MIRKFEQADIGQVMHLWLNGNVEAHPFVPENYWISNYQMVQEQISQAEVYVSENDGEIQGFIGLADGHIAGIFVGSKYRSKGIGKQLLDYAKERYGALFLNVYQQNKRAVDFYRREGFFVSAEGADEKTGSAEYTMLWKANDGFVKKIQISRLWEHPELTEKSAEWFSSKWGIPAEAYRESIQECIARRSGVPQWYVILNNKQDIIAGAGIIENDFHDRKDLTPNLCALFVEEKYRERGIARRILDFARHDMGDMGIEKLYLVTDHTDFYEKCGWEFLTMVCDDDGRMERMYAAETKGV